MKKINNDLEAMQALIAGEVLQHVHKSGDVIYEWKLEQGGMISKGSEEYLNCRAHIRSNC